MLSLFFFIDRLCRLLSIFRPGQDAKLIVFSFHRCCALIGKVTNLDILSFLSCCDKHKIHTQLTVCSLCMFSSGVSSFFVLALQGGP